MTVKKIPMRMCTGCHEMKPKKELIRVVKTPEGEIKLDFTGKLTAEGLISATVPNALKKRKSKIPCHALLVWRYRPRFTII